MTILKRDFPASAFSSLNLVVSISVYSVSFFYTGLRLSDLPVFMCIVCGHRIRSEFEVSCTGDVKRNVEKAPLCCGKAMIEVIDD